MAATLAILVDVGSTWTKGVAVDLEKGELRARSQHPTTVASGVMTAVDAVVGELRESSEGEVAYRAATSSAAGGLRVAAIGLVPDLTSTAARQASLGAGARVVFSGSYVLTEGDIGKLVQASPDIVLLTGGTDGGNSEVILENARRLATASIGLPVVFAGNRSAEDEARSLLVAAGYEVRVAANVLPTLDRLETDSAQSAIRDLFLERIVLARGIEELRAWSSDRLLPTPRAVLEAAALVGNPGSGLGFTVLVDVGGATTDVHSVGSAEPEPGIHVRGLPEPRLKRTVEGDLGLRVSAAAAVESVGRTQVAAPLHADLDGLRHEAERRSGETSTVVDDDPFDRVLTTAITAEALVRHAGTLEELPTRPRAWALRGKDLRPAAALVASGGVFAARADAAGLMADALELTARSDRLVPTEPRLLVDRNYVMFAVGLLAEQFPSAAAALARESLGL